MNNREQEIENALRSAPRPAPPAGLKNTLISQVKLPMGHASSQPALGSSTFGDWLRPWWPALVPAAVSVACAVAITVQQREINSLKESIQAAAEQIAASKVAPAPIQVRSSAVPAGAASYQEEIARQKQRVEQLKAEVAQLEKFRAENVQLKSQLARASLPPELQGFTSTLQEVQDQVSRVRCVNNLKQFGLAVRIWAGDHNDINPPDIISMSKELSSPKILVCPADTNRPAAVNWANFTAANCSYEYLAPSGSDREPSRVLSRCPVHGTVGLCDGSVQQVGQDASQSFVQRDGKIYFERATALQPGMAHSHEAFEVTFGADGRRMTSPHDGLIRDWEGSPEQAVENACINNLRQIDGAKQQWALENKQTAQAIPTPQDIAPYLKTWPACPSGGQYLLNSVGVNPTCSVPNHRLTSYK